MLHLVTLPGGTAPKAQVIGYSVGGKSGTAYKQEGTGYATKKYRAWFVGMAPIAHPRIIVAVMVDEPTAGKYFGGDVAAPVFSEVVQQTLRMMGVPPDLDVKPQIVSRDDAGRRGELLMAAADPPAWRGSIRARRRMPGWLLRRRAPLSSPTAARVGAGDAFIAWPGYASDGRRFVDAAIAAGAGACLVEAEGVEAFGFDADPRVAALHGLKAAAGDIASRFLRRAERAARRRRRHRHQRQDVDRLVGRAGAAARSASAAASSARSASASRRRGRPGGDSRSTGLTTPDPITLQDALRDFADRRLRGVRDRGLVDRHRRASPRRHAGRVAVFTNFTQDHLDYHGDMRAYWQAKAQLFAWPGLRAAVVNIDDARGARARSHARSRAAIDAWTVSSARRAARLRRGRRPLRPRRPRLRCLPKAMRSVAVETPVIGDFNVSNLLGVVGVLRALGVALADAARGLRGADAGARPHATRRDAAAPMRLPEVVVDYAHTPDALEKALAALRAARRGARRRAVVRVRLRRQPRRRQAAADGRDRAAGSPTASSSPATTRASNRPTSSWRRSSSARSATTRST